MARDLKRRSQKRLVARGSWLVARGSWLKLNLALYCVIHPNSLKFYEPSLLLVSLAVIIHHFIIILFSTFLRQKWNIKKGRRILKILALSLGAVLVTAQAYSIEMIELEKSHLLAPITIPVRVQFITQEDQRYAGSTLLQYHAALCGGCTFDGLNTRFAVNLANNPWDDETGDTITVHAKDSTGTVIATNLIGTDNKPVPDFNFTYTSK